MTIGFAARLFVILLVVLLADVEVGGGEDQGVDLIATVAEYLDDGFGITFLSLVTVEEATAVLRPEVGTDAIGLGGVVNLEEELAELRVGDLLRVVLHDDRLDVVSEVVAHLGIGGERLSATGITCQGAEYAFLAVELMLGAPETTAGKDGDADVGVGRRLVEVDAGTGIDGLFNFGQHIAVLLQQVRVSLAATIVVLQVVVLDLQGDGVFRVDDVLNVVFVRDGTVAGKDSHGIDDADRDATVQEVLASDVGVLDHVVQEARHLLFVSMAHQANRQRMKDIGVSVFVHLAGVGLHGNL